MDMMKKLLLLLSIFSAGFAYSQTMDWQKLYGGTDSDKATCVSNIFDSSSQNFSVCVAGHYKSSDGDFSSNYGNYDCFVADFDDSGNEIWKTTFGGTDADYIYAMGYNSTNIVVVGTSKSNDNDITGNHGNYDMLVVKLDLSGNIVWQKSFGGTEVDKATSVQVTDTGEIFVLGYSKSTDGDVTAGANHGNYDIWLLKLDANGNILWQKNYGGSNDDRSTDLISDYNTDLYFTGYSKSNDGDLTSNQGNFDYWVVKIDDTGTIIWQHSYGGSGIDKEPHISLAYTFLVAGYSNSTDGDITAPKGSFDIWALGLNETNGNMSWEKSYGGTGADFATGINNHYAHVTFNRSQGLPDAYILGYSNSDDGDFPTNAGNYDAWLLGIDSYGLVVNSLYLGGNNVDKILGIGLEANYIVGTSKSDTGDFANQHGNYDAWLLNVSLPFNTGSIAENQININTYPNPVKDYVHIATDDILMISLFDATGKRVLQIQTPDRPDNLDLNLSNLSKGNYLLKVLSKKGVGNKMILKK